MQAWAPNQSQQRRHRRFRALGPCFFLLAAGACGSGSSVSSFDECREPSKICDGICVDTTADPKNCGGCDQECGAGQACNEGLCCEQGATNCDESCVDTDTDPDHCGACGNSCGADEVCASGSCAACPGGSTACTDSCVDLELDPANCGACGNACDADSVCNTGNCEAVCFGGSSLCGDDCVRLDSDPDHCGGCGDACDTDEVCSEGECAATCAGGSTECDGGCVDTQLDPAHCGGCGDACEAGQVCSAGECGLECSGGSTRCGDMCVDTDADRAHCGECDHACPAGQVCSDGECRLECSGGSTKCGDMCIDTDVDPAHCGECDNACEAGQVCSDGECGLKCSGGSTKCGDMCVNTEVDPAHCGECDNACDSGEVCSAGGCALECSGGSTQCGNECVDTKVDPAHCGDCDSTCAVTEVCKAGKCQAALLEFDTIAPGSAYYPGGLEVTISGNAFDSSTAVTIGGKPCLRRVLVSGQQLRCFVPAGAEGPADVVLSKGDEVATGEGVFTYRGFSRVDTVAGTGTEGDQDGAGDVAQFSGSLNSFQIVGSTLYVADGLNYKVRTIDLSGLDMGNVQPSDVTVATLAGSGALGIADSSDSTGATAQFQQPTELEFIGGDFLYATDTDWVGFPAEASAIRRINRHTGETVTLLRGVDAFAGLAYTDAFIYANECGNDNTLKRWEVDTGIAVDFAGTVGSWGDLDGVADAAKFNCPFALGVDAAHEYLYLTDWANSKIKRVEIATRTVTTIAGTGVPGFIDGDILTAQFDAPSQLSVADAHVFVADMDNCAIRQIDLSASEVETIAGAPGACTATDGPLEAAAFGSPSSIQYSPTHGILVGTGNWGWRKNVTSDYKVRLIH